MSRVQITLLLLAASTASLGPLCAAPRLIAPDQLTGDVGSELRQRARDVVLLAPSEYVTEDDAGIVLATDLGTDLCPNQRFAREQTVGATCSGVLFQTGLVLTAAHCLDERPIDRWRVVFGHDGDPKTPLRSVGIRAIRHCVPNTERGDLVALELDQAITPMSPSKVGPPHANGLVHLLGHPFGLMLKASTCIGANHCDTKPHATQIGVDWFLADLDTFRGNSGSPVYAEDGKTLVGIWSSSPSGLVRGKHRSKGACWNYASATGVNWGGKATRVDWFVSELTAGDNLLARCARATP
jgi:hypothetical protein